MLELNHARVTSRQRSDIGNKFILIHRSPLLVRENAIIGKILLPWCLITGCNRIVQLLRSPHQFLLGDGRILLGRQRDGRGQQNNGQKTKSHAAALCFLSSSFSILSFLPTAMTYAAVGIAKPSPLA